MNEILRETNALIESEPSAVFYLWTSDVVDSVVPLNRVCLYIVHMSHEGPVFLRVFHTRRKGKEPCVVYSPDAQLFRITSGKRRGWVVPFSEIKETDTYCAAGIRKHLVAGKAPACFSVNRAGDRVLLDVLTLLTANRQHVEKLESEMRVPDMFIATKLKWGLSIRGNGICANKISALPEYRDLMTRTQIVELAMSSFRVSSDKYTLYPYDMFYGKGELMCRLIGDCWRKVQKTDFGINANHFIVEGMA